MYKSCKTCHKMTTHTSKVDSHNGKKTFTCSVCGSISKGLSALERARLEERRAEIYKDRTFEDLMGHVQRESEKEG